jgi:hypothetical protein
MGGQPGKPKPPGNPPVRPEPQEPKPIRRHRYRFLQWRGPLPRSERIGYLAGRHERPGTRVKRARRNYPWGGAARQFLYYFRRRTLNCNAVLVIGADLDRTLALSGVRPG